MSNSSRRDGDIERLHPAIREKVRAIRAQLHKEKIPFEVFEAFRTPERQAQLWAKGRTTKGPKVTWVGPWHSIHQYGLAVDFVLKPDGKWSWDDQGAEAAHWERMHALAREHGMTPLFNKAGKLIEKPHIQLEGMKAADLYAGRYPDGGDAVWAEHLGALIDGWEGSPAAPPKPEAAPERPGLAEADVAEMEAEVAAALPAARAAAPRLAGAEAAAEDARFQRLHGFVKRWEGGFADHPRDKGGPTNMGITQGTLAAWRGTEVTREDVKALGRAEADAIFRANYYTLCRCGEMPERVAVVVYNGAVLHGPKTSVKLLQEGFNALGMTADGAPLEVDGVLGPKTMAAATETDPGVLAGAYMDAEDAYFRAHGDFDVFGKGWLNRLAALREFVETLPQGAGKRPETVMRIGSGKLDLDLDIEEVLGEVLAAKTGGRSGMARALARAALRKRLARAGDDPARAVLRGVLAETLDLPAPEEAAKGQLTPVNAALGQTIGQALNGKKSVIGVVGLLATAVLPHVGLSGPLLSFLQVNSSEILTVLATFTGWGFLGKIDKVLHQIKAQV